MTAKRRAAKLKNAHPETVALRVQSAIDPDPITALAPSEDTPDADQALPQLNQPVPDAKIHPQIALSPAASAHLASDDPQPAVSAHLASDPQGAAIAALKIPLTQILDIVLNVRVLLITFLILWLAPSFALLYAFIFALWVIYPRLSASTRESIQQQIPTILKEQQVTKGVRWTEIRKTLLEFLDYHKVPAAVLLLFCTIPRLIPLWVLVILLWTLLESVLPKLPERMRRPLAALMPVAVARADWFQQLREGINQMRPFILFMLYIGCAPIALVWMFCHWIGRVLGLKPARVVPNDPEGIVLTMQNRRRDEDQEKDTFYHSPAFTITACLLFLSGVPAAVSYFLYYHLGIDAIMLNPSSDPQFFTVIVIIQLYIASVASAISVLFLKSWFTFPLNFLASECSLVLTAEGVRKHAADGWFYTVVTFNNPRGGASFLSWKNVNSAAYYSGTAIRLYPLPDTLISKTSPVYRFLNKYAALIDAIVERLGRRDFMILHAKNGEQLTIKLSELTNDERAKFFYSMRKWAPDVVIEASLQEQLIGSRVLRDTRYTELWFDLLTSTSTVNRQNLLQPGEMLRQGSVIIESRIASGGQANVYAGEQKGEPVVLKEFILSNSDAAGALAESASDFENEAAILSRLRSPHIVALRDMFIENRRAYLVLERVEGESLRSRIKRDGAMNEEAVRDLAVQMCTILDYLHAQEPPVVHRDFTPDNLILQTDGKLKLIDFSLALSSGGSISADVVGKHSYTAPEQFRDDARPQSDIYSLGATLYFLLTGKDPKPISSSSPKEKVDGLSDRLDHIVKTATELELDKRYGSIEWLRLDLQTE